MAKMNFHFQNCWICKGKGEEQMANHLTSCKKQVLQVLLNSIFFSFSAKFVQFSTKYFSFDVEIRKHLKNIIFTACKWCKLCKYYVNIIILSYGTCQMEEYKCTLVKCLIYAFLLQFQFSCNLSNFSAKS